MGKRSRRMERKEKRLKRMKTVNGVLSTAAGGFGFVNAADGTEVFIPPSGMNGALDGDAVETQITSERDERGPVGRVSRILNRGREFMVCELVDGHSARPLNRNIPTTIKISGSLKGAKKGDWVKLRLLDSGSKYTESLRGALLYGAAPDYLLLGVWFVIGLALTAIGITTVYRYENSYAKVI